MQYQFPDYETTPTLFVFTVTEMLLVLLLYYVILPVRVPSRRLRQLQADATPSGPVQMNYSIVVCWGRWTLTTQPQTMLDAQIERERDTQNHKKFFHRTWTW